MPTPDAQQLKEQVRDFWNQQSCGTEVASGTKFSREYFEEIEEFRYFDAPFIHAFAQFTRYHSKKVLEVGFGAGTDFTQWLRAGARATGIDLTPEALEHLASRIRAYGLPPPEGIQVGDAENLPFAENSFDLGYSFGVLHHSPNTEKAVAELTRVIRPGGDLKIMLYNRRSIWAWNCWFKHALLRGRPWKTPAWVLWHFVESAGTKGYSRRELARMLAPLPLESIQVHTEFTSADYLSASAFRPLNLFYRLCLRLAGTQQSWHPSHYVSRGTPPVSPAGRRPLRDPRTIMFTGNRLGFFHCISAVKRH